MSDEAAALHVHAVGIDGVQLVLVRGVDDHFAATGRQRARRNDHAAIGRSGERLDRGRDASVRVANLDRAHREPER